MSETFSFEEAGVAAAPPEVAGGNTFSFEEALAAPKAAVGDKPEAPSSPGRDFAGSAASLIDLPLSFPGAVVGVGASLGATLVGAAAKPWTGESWGNIYKSALESGSQVSEALINPMQKVLKAFGVEKEYEDAPVTQAMNFVSEKIAEGSNSVEQKTGIPAAGLQILANEILTLGIPGLGSATKRGVMKLNDFVQDAAAARKATGAKETLASVDEILRGYGERAAGPELPVGEAPYRQPTPFKVSESGGSWKSYTPDDAGKSAASTAQNMMQSGATKKAAEAATKNNPTLASVMEEIRAKRADAKESFGRGVQQGEWLGPEEPTNLGGEAQVRPAILGASEAEGAQRLLAASKADPRLLGKGEIDPKLLVALGLATGTAALAGVYPEEAKKAMGGLALGGALLATSGKMPDIGALRTLGGELAQGKYTLKTLERLPQNRTEIPKAMIEQELRRADVSKAEKDVLTEVLATKGEQVTSQELVRDFRLATGDHTLEAKATGEYADYGLDRIDRMTADSLRNIDREPQPGDPGAHPTTTLYRLPEHMELSDANHFKDPRLFGWTRSFDEGGVKHVVEVQSDLAQHTKGAAPPEQAIDILNKRVEVDDALKVFAEHDRQFDKSPTGDTKISVQELYDLGDKVLGKTFDRSRGLKYVRDELAAKADELRVKAEATSINANVGPMLKHWPRRLIREELAASAKKRQSHEVLLKDIENSTADDFALGEQGRQEALEFEQQFLGKPDVVRFATADTVAKVEGWGTNEYRLARLKEDAADVQKKLDSVDRYYSVEDRAQAKVYHEHQLKQVEKDIADFKPGFTDPGHQSIHSRYRTDIETYLKGLGGKEVVDASGHSWIEVPTSQHKGRIQQYGNIDRNLLIKAGIISTGLVAGGFLADDPIRGAFLGGLLGLGLGALPKTSLARGIEYAGGITSTRIANISKPIWHRAVALELGVFDRTHKAIAAVDPFLEKMNKLPKDSKAALNSALLRNDFSAVEQVLRGSGDPQFAKDWIEVRKTLDSLGKELKQAGILSHMREDYFPRMVADREGLLAQMGFEQKTKLQEKLARAEAAALRRGETSLSTEEASSIINTFMQQGGLGGGRKPSFTQHRKIENLTPEMEEFYFSPTEAFHTYARTAVKELEKVRFFGKDAVRVEHNGKPRLDIEQSIGQLIERELRQKTIIPEQVPEMASLLRSRFIGGERVSSKFVQDAKNYGNIALLGDLTSGLVQSGDAIMSVYQTGLRPTLKTVVQQITGKQQVSMKDFGLADHISEEFVGTRKSAKILNFVLKPVFSKIDAWGKDIVLNSAINSAQRLARTESGAAKLGEKYAAAFGSDFPQLLADLKSKQVTPQVKLLAFHELSNLQPVSKLEMPQGYLDNPNGRILYMLKSYQLKQFDILRRDAYQEIKNGRIAKGLGNLTKLGITLGIAGATTAQVRSWILGIDDPLEGSDVWDNALKTYGWSSYVQDKVQAGKPAEAVAGLVAPPYKVMDTLIQQDPRAVSYLPWFGKTIYHRGMGGAEKVEESRKRREAAAERRARLRKLD